MAYDLVAKLRLVDNLTGPLKRATMGIGGIAGSALKASAAIAGIGGAVGVVAVAVDSVNKAMNFESQIDSVAALDNSIAKGTQGYQKMQALALQMGAKTQYSALEAAQGMEELVKAGMSVETMMGGGLEAALNLAAAGGVQVADAASVMAVAMNSFKKDGMSAADAANILAGTANASATGVNELRYGIAAVGSVASGLNMTFKDTAAAIGLFTNNGLQAADAGTSLKAMFAGLQPTTKDEIAVMKRLGIVTKDGTNKFFDQAGNVQTLDKLAGVLKESLTGLTAKQRDLALKTMFGSDAIRAGNILFDEGAAGVQKFNKEMSKTTALDIARKKMDNAKGAVEQFKGALETLQISALLPTLPIIKKLANAGADLMVQYGPKMTAAVEGALRTAKGYIRTNFLDNQEFRNLPDIKSKILFVWENLMQSFNRWLDNGGRNNISQIATNIINFLSDALKASQPLIDAAVKIGAALGKGMLDGLMNFAREHPEIAALMAGMATPGPIQVKIAAAGVAAVTPQFSGLPAKLKADSDRLKGYQKRDGSVLGTFNEWADRTIKNLKIDWNGSSKAERDKAYQQSKAARGHASGLDRVPYDGYLARLHKNETVLTSAQAQTYRSGGGGNSFTFGDININGASGNVADMADDLMREIARRVSEAGGQM